MFRWFFSLAFPFFWARPYLEFPYYKGIPVSPWMKTYIFLVALGFLKLFWGFSFFFFKFDDDMSGAPRWFPVRGRVRWCLCLLGCSELLRWAVDEGGFA